MSTPSKSKKQSLKNWTDRLRRKVERGIAFCKQQGFPIENGCYFSDGNGVCAMSAVAVQRTNTTKEAIDTDPNGYGKLVTVVSMRVEEEAGSDSIDDFAARELGITRGQVGALIEGFDDPDEGPRYAKGSRKNAAYRLGQRLAKKHAENYEPTEELNTNWESQQDSGHIRSGPSRGCGRKSERVTVASFSLCPWEPARLERAEP